MADLNKLRLQLFTDQVLPKLRQAKVNQATIDSALYQWGSPDSPGCWAMLDSYRQSGNRDDSKGAGSVSMPGASPPVCR